MPSFLGYSSVNAIVSGKLELVSAARLLIRP